MEGTAFPPGVLALVFEQLDVANRLRARRVCRDWRGQAAIGCAHLKVNLHNLSVRGHRHLGHVSYRVGRVRLYGRRSKLDLEDDVAKGTDEETTFDKARWMNRTCGRLPQPVVLDTEEELAETVPHELRQTRGGAALLVDRSVVSLRNQLEAADDTGGSGPGSSSILAVSDTNSAEEHEQVAADSDSESDDENGDGRLDPQTSELFHEMQWYTNTKYEKEQANESRNATVLQSLDLAASTFHPFMRISNDGGTDSYRDIKPRTLQRLLVRVDVGGLCWLQSISVRGCSNLEVMLVPPCLTALDASSASHLHTLNYGHNDSVKHAGCKVLNLSGCRELTSAGILDHPQSMAHCRELDISYCQRLPAAAVSTALASATALASLSIRNVAKDVILQSLASSPAAACTLRLVDCAFSDGLTDVAVERLVQAAPHLQRVNLRGCTAVSTLCYNQTPITLATRSMEQVTGSTGASADATVTSPHGASRKLRKGDNVFFFASR